MRAVEADGELAGFVMVAEATEHHPVPYLWRLLIDRRHQRRGIGERVIALLVERLRADGHDGDARQVAPGPGGPEPFYLGRGFVRTGEVHDGEIEGRLTFMARHHLTSSMATRHTLPAGVWSRYCTYFATSASTAAAAPARRRATSARPRTRTHHSCDQSSS